MSSDTPRALSVRGVNYPPYKGGVDTLTAPDTPVSDTDRSRLTPAGARTHQMVVDATTAWDEPLEEDEAVDERTEAAEARATIARWLVRDAERWEREAPSTLDHERARAALDNARLRLAEAEHELEELEGDDR